MPAASALVISSTPTRENLIISSLSQAGWQTETAASPAVALEMLRDGGFAAVFCDEALRGATAAGFLAWTRKLQPHARFYLFAPEDGWKAPARPDAFFSWPPILAEIPLAPGTQTSQEPAYAGSGVPLSGSTALVSLPQLLEMLGNGRRSATVRLHGGRGHVYVEGGMVLHAAHHENGNLRTGMGALADLMELEDIDFAVEEFTRPGRTTINLPVPGAVAEAARQADEQRRDRRLLSWIMQHQPGLQAVATGYHLAPAPTFGHGDAAALFRQAAALLNAARSVTGAPPRSLSVAGERHSVAVYVVGSGRLVAASVAGHTGAVLLRLLEKAVAATGD